MFTVLGMAPELTAEIVTYRTSSAVPSNFCSMCFLTCSLTVPSAALLLMVIFSKSSLREHMVPILLATLSRVTVYGVPGTRL